MRSALLVLILATPAWAQVETEVAEVASLKLNIATLKADLLVQRLATLQAKANWIDRERILIATEERELRVDREKVALEIAELLDCANEYDLVARACAEMAE